MRKAMIVAAGSVLVLTTGCGWLEGVAGLIASVFQVQGIGGF